MKKNTVEGVSLIPTNKKYYVKKNDIQFLISFF